MVKQNTAKNNDLNPCDATLRVVAGGGKNMNAEPLDRLIHERMRLAIVSALAVNPSLSFSELKKLLDTSDGNLSVHTQKLEEAGYIACKKTFEGRKPKTVFSITKNGRKILEKYLNHMEALIKTVRKE